MPERRIHGFSKEQNVFNEWHRKHSIKRWLTEQDASRLYAMDLDLIEYDWNTGKVVLLHEVAEDRGQRNKQTRVMTELAKDADLYALCTLYTVSIHPNPANPQVPDISRFRVRRVWPDPQENFTVLSPSEYAKHLNTLCKRLKSSSQ